MKNPKLAFSFSLLAVTLLLSAKWTNQRCPSGPHRRTLIYIRRYPMTTVLTAVMFLSFLVSTSLRRVTAASTAPSSSAAVVPHGIWARCILLYER